MPLTQRDAGTLHRSNISAADKLSTPATPTAADIATGGVLLAGTTYNAAVSAATQSGVTPASTAVAQATAADASNTHGVRVAVAQAANAQNYDIFCSTDAAPKWVGRVSEAQRAAGVAIRAVGAVGGDQPNDIAGKIRTALGLDTELAGIFTISGSTSHIILTDKTQRANDSTLNIAMADDTCVGSVAVPTSANTTAGVLPVLQVETATTLGAISGAGNIAVIVTASGMGNSPKTISVAVADNDTAAQVATKVRAALTADTDVSAFFTVSGTTTAVVLTAKTKAANDSTMNVDTDNDTSHGLMDTPTSVHTTAGAAPVAQVETATIVGTIDVAGAGNATIVVTAAGMGNSPKTLSVAVANNDTASQVATKVRAALTADTDVNGFFVVSGATDKVILTARTAAANDATLNIASDNGTCTGLTTEASSANTTAGVAGTLQVETATIAGTISGAGNATVIVTAAGMTGSPRTVSVAVANLDSASAVGGKIRTALGLDADVSTWFSVGGSGAGVVLTAIAAAANDATMNIDIDNGTCFGLTDAPTSTHTTAGVAGVAQVETATVDAASLIAVGGNLKVTVVSARFYAGSKTFEVAVSAASGVAGHVDVYVVGTGVASTAAPFILNSAYLIPAGGGVPCAGFGNALVLVRVRPTFAGTPSLTLAFFVQSAYSPADWFMYGAEVSPTLTGATGANFEWQYLVAVNGALGFAVLVEAIANCAVDVIVELGT